MKANCTPEQLAELQSRRNASFAENTGLIGPNDRHQLERSWHNFGSHISKRQGLKDGAGAQNESNENNITSKQRMLAEFCQQQLDFCRVQESNDQFHKSFSLLTHERGGSLYKSGHKFNETTGSADIAAYTTQIIAFLMPIFERIMIDEMVHFRTMQGPRAFIHTLDYKRGTGGGLYSANTSFSGNLDVDYAACPTECTDANEVDLDIVSQTITAVCKRLQAKWCLPAQQDYRSQHGRSISDDVRGMIQLEFIREKQGEILADLIANAAHTSSWAETIPGGSVYLTLDPKAYAATLFDAVQDLDNEIFKTEYRKSNWLAGDPDGLVILQKLNSFRLTENDRGPRNTGVGQIDQFGNLFGVANFQWKVFKFPLMQARTLLIGVKSDAPNEVGYIHAEYVPLFDLGVFLDPSTGEYRTGMQTRYANTTLRPNLYGALTITA